MKYQLKQIHCRPWTLSGLSLKLIESHYENNYGGALRRLNAITEQLESLDYAKTLGYVLNGLKREELVALNSTLLHELYFASMGGVPILALDMYEHAYHIDFGANVKAYVDTFLRNVDWDAVEGCHEDATKVAPPRPLLQPEFGDIKGVGVEEVRAMLAEGKPLQLIDTRPKHFVSRQQDIAEGVTWRDPELVTEWMGELSKEAPVVVYCAYGFHVGCKTAIALRDAGFDARYMNVGHSGWKAVGAPIQMNG